MLKDFSSKSYKERLRLNMLYRLKKRHPVECNISTYASVVSFREQDDFAPVVCIACNNCGSHSFRMDRQLKIFSTEIKYLHPMATSQLFQEVRVATQLEPMFGRVPATMVQRSNS